MHVGHQLAGVLAGYGEGLVADVPGVYRGVGQEAGQHDGDAAAAGTDIEDRGLVFRLGVIARHQAYQLFGFGPWNKHRGRYLEGKAAEFGRADDVLNGFVAVESRHNSVPVGLDLRVGNRAVDHHVHAPQAQIMLQKHEGNGLGFFGRIGVYLLNKVVVELTGRGHEKDWFRYLGPKVSEFSREAPPGGRSFLACPPQCTTTKI